MSLCRAVVISLSLLARYPCSSAATAQVIKDIYKTGRCSCKAIYNDGSERVFDLSGAPWKHLATDSSDKGGNVIITWYYSPCESYNVPGDKKGDCNGVGVCMAQGEKFYNYGKASSATCVTTLNGSYPVLQYSGDNGVAFVTLSCATIERVTFVSINKSAYISLSSICSCGNVCVTTPHSGTSLSGGSIVLILFFSLVFVYFVGGLLFLRLSRGATGVEAIPNYHLWISLPGLVKDGVMFLLNGCQARASYEKI